MAKELMDKLLTLCNTPLSQDKMGLGTVQEKSFHAVARHLVKEVISPNENVRKQVRKTTPVQCSPPPPPPQASVVCGVVGKYFCNYL